MGGRLSHALSVTSLDSRCTARTGRSTRSLSPPPPAAGQSDAAASRRRFSSRHVPSVAEELARSQALTPEIITRFNGLMRHLKRNTDWEEQQKQVMVSNMDELVPEEYEEMLRSEFERRCEFGERMNTEMMVSAKWVRWLKDIGAIAGPTQDKRSAQHRDGAVTLADADIIFRKVLHDCDYGGRKLSYELFCKALYLLAQACRPDLDGEAAFAEVLARISAAVPEDRDKPHESVDHMLDPNVMLVLDHFKPALHDLFKTFCKRHLSNPSSASRGLGTVRIRERTTWKHSQETGMMTGAAGLTANGDPGSSQSPTRRSRARHSDSSVCGEAGGRSPGSQASSFNSPPSPSLADLGVDAAATISAYSMFASSSTLATAAPHDAEGTAATPSAESGSQAGASEKELGQRKPPGSPVRTVRQDTPLSSEADAGGGCADVARRSAHTELRLPQAELHSCPGLLPPHGGAGSPLGHLGCSGGLVMHPSSPHGHSSPGRVGSPLSPKSPGGVASVLAWAETRGWVCQSATNTMAGTTICSTQTSATQDPYLYANGAPVIKNRHKYMSAEQMLELCRELKVLPDLLTRTEVIKVFKRSQLIGSPTSVGSSIHGFLTQEAFVTAVGHLALDAYSKEPFCDEYPEPHEKVHAFMLVVLPRSAREVRERFLWSCAGRDR